MLTITPRAGPVHHAQERRDLTEDLAERLRKRYELAAKARIAETPSLDCAPTRAWFRQKDHGYGFEPSKGAVSRREPAGRILRLVNQLSCTMGAGVQANVSRHHHRDLLVRLK
ncbi:MAG: hypothetical protein WCA28_12665, partial [Bradyrhizobium sp.]